MNKTFRILEVLWLIIACAMLGISVWFFITGDSASGIFFIGFTGFCVIMNRIRKRQSKFYNKPGDDKK